MSDSEAIRQRIRHALRQVIDPELRQPLPDLGMIGDISVSADGVATVTLKLTISGCPAATSLEQQVRECVSAVSGVSTAVVDVIVMTREERTALITRLRGPGRPRQFGPDSLTRVYAVTSGKGGVGKSTVTAELAIALSRRGLRVGLIDADVFGFSIPAVLGIPHARPTRVGEMILPPIAHGVAVISIGMFVEHTPGKPAPAVAWRGPMLHRTIEQFLTDVYFGDLDIVLLDLPPGTGDIAISVGQLLPHAEVIVVTTPQPAAADVAERSGIVARQTGQTVFGVVENMAGLAGPDGTVLDLFGAGGGQLLADRLGVPLLASIPLSIPLRHGGDTGVPLSLDPGDDPAAAAITQLAETLATRPRGLAGRKLGVSVR